MYRILFIDDDKNICLVARKILSVNEQYEVDTSSSYDEAYTLYREKKPDLVITDYVLDKLNGLELAADIRLLTPNQDIILISGFQDKSFIINALNEGINSFLPKPFHWPELLDKVTKFYYLYISRMSKRVAFNIVDSIESTIFFRNDMTNLYAIADWMTFEIVPFFPDHEIRQMNTAILEGLYNAIEHGNLGLTKDVKEKLLNENSYDEEIKRLQANPENSCKRIVVTKRLNGDALTISIKDQGKGFDPEMLKKTPLEAYSGRGLLIIREVFDEVRFEAGGTMLVIVKNLPKQESQGK